MVTTLRVAGTPSTATMTTPVIPIPSSRSRGSYPQLRPQSRTGGTALWLAEQGFDVTLIDVSQVALDIVRQEARRRTLSLSTVHHDLESSGLLAGIWDIAVCCDFFDRTLYSTLHRHVAPNGLLFVRVATVTNQQRHSRPSKKYLVEPGELPGLLPGFTTVSYNEDWFDDRHEARFVARRTVE